ncbi:MAG: cytochrome C [Pseudomonadota bacterium]
MSVASALVYVLAAAAAGPGTETADGAALAIGCAGCHAGPTALEVGGADALFSALEAWRDRRDDGAVMTRIARGFTPEELRAIAEYLAQT